MSDDTAAELAACLRFATLVNKVLPIDEEMDRRVTAALNRHADTRVRRKLTRKVP